MQCFRFQTYKVNSHYINIWVCPQITKERAQCPQIYSRERRLCDPSYTNTHCKLPLFMSSHFFGKNRIKDKLLGCRQALTAEQQISPVQPRLPANGITEQHRLQISGLIFALVSSPGKNACTSCQVYGRNSCVPLPPGVWAEHWCWGSWLQVPECWVQTENWRKPSHLNLPWPAPRSTSDQFLWNAQAQERWALSVSKDINITKMQHCHWNEWGGTQCLIWPP